MASVLSRPAPPPAAYRSPPLPPSRDRVRWPVEAGGRWLLRLALAAPLIALVLLTYRAGYRSPADDELVRRAFLVRHGAGGLADLRYAFPPVPVLVAMLPRYWLGLTAAAAAAVALASALEMLVLRQVRGPLAILLLVPVVCVPAVPAAATGATASVLALALLAVALHGFVRFVVDGHTEGGFAAGLALGAAACCDPVAVAYAPALAVAAPLLVGRLRRDAWATTTATALVLVFPTAAVVAGWAFLGWWFAGGSALVVGVPTAGLADATRTVGLALAHTPLYVLTVLLVLVRRPIAAAGCLVPVLGLLLAGLVRAPYPPVYGYALLTLVALAIVPYRPRGNLAWLLAFVALGQCALGVLWPPGGADLAAWLAALGWS